MRWDFRQKKINTKRSTVAKFQNPLYQKGSWKNFIIDKFSFFSWLVILILLSLIYIIFYSPMLIINKIEITGTSNISSQTIEDKYVKWQLNQSKWIIFKQNNILLFNKKWLESNIEEQYSLASLDIDKKLPHTLIINIEETIPNLIWKTDNKNYYLGQDGVVASLIPEGKIPDNVPIITNESNETTKPGQAVFTNDKVAFTKSLVEKIQTVRNLEINGYSTPHQLSTQINVQSAEGYLIYFDSTKNLDTQIEKLNRVLNESELAESPQEYIDLRIGERVYIK